MEDIEPKRRGRPPGSGNARVEVFDPVVPEVAAEPKVQVRVARDFWTDEGRIRSGAVISVTISQALKGVKNGSLEPVED